MMPYLVLHSINSISRVRLRDTTQEIRFVGPAGGDAGGVQGTKPEGGQVGS